MAVKLRLRRMGNRHRPMYRLTAVDGRKKRDGRVIEELGSYDPQFRNGAGRVKFDLERCKYWISVGAQPSDTGASLLKRHGVVPHAGTKLDDQPAEAAAKAAAPT